MMYPSQFYVSYGKVMIKILAIHLRVATHATYRTKGNSYTMVYRKRKEFRISKIGLPKYKEVKVKGVLKWKLNTGKPVVLWDVIGFYQTSFVEALKTWFK